LEFEADVRFRGLDDDAGPNSLGLRALLEVQALSPAAQLGEWSLADTFQSVFSVAADAQL